jgi:FixJ family two-component response regulator
MNALELQTPNRILVVDDERLVAANLRDLFQSLGRHAQAVYDGRAAVRAILEAPFDLILLDMRMPGFGGLEVLTEILRHRPDLCVVVLTGHGTVATAVEAVCRGAAAMVEKRFDFDQLVPLIDHHYTTHLQRAQFRRAKEEATRAELFLGLANAMSHLGKNRGVSIGYALYKLRRAIAGRPDAAALSEYIGWADTAHESLMHALDRLNLFARLPTFESQPVDLRRAIDEAVTDAFRFYLPDDTSERPEIRLDVLPSELLVRGHPQFLPAAIEFLIQNAIDEFRAGSPKPWWIEIRAVTDRDYVRVAVLDSGPGFPPEILDWFGDPNRAGRVPLPRAAQPHKAGTSFGIGLSCAYQVVQACGGQFSIGNRVPSGAIVEFTLPRVSESIDRKRETVLGAGRM